MQNPRQDDIFVMPTISLFAMNDFYPVLDEMRRCTAAFTGHRTYKGVADAELMMTIADLHKRGITRFLCGMSWGFDLAAGRCVLEFKEKNPWVELIAVEPCAEFGSLFSGADKELYDKILAAADARVVVGENDKGAYMLRNDYLVNNASVVVAWYNNIPRGGTAYTVRRARKNRVEVVNLYPEPQLDLDF